MIIKVENALSENVLRQVRAVTSSRDIPWYMGESTAYRGTNENLFDFSFSHLVFQDNPRSELFAVLHMAFLMCLDKAGQSLDQLYRMRLGLITPTQERVIHDAHIDIDHMPHVNGLLYLNDSDGPTHIYNEQFDISKGMSSQEYIKGLELTVKEAVDPKENTFVSFDGLNYHSSSTPVLHKKRLVLNCNYSLK